MKKTILLLLAILFINSVNAQGEYDSNGLKTGKWRILHKKNHNFHEIGYFEKGKREGEWKEYFFNKLSQSGQYINGKKNGVWKLYFGSHSEKKNISATGKFYKGKRDGQWKFYYRKGKIEKIGNYRNGSKIGEWKLYSKEGNLIKTENY